jgi:hypothetical protein
VRGGSIQVASEVNGTTGRGNPQPIFLTGYSEFQQVRDDIEQMPAFGANIVQVEIGPWHVFPKPDVVDTKPIQALVDVLARAANAGVSVDVKSPAIISG